MYNIYEQTKQKMNHAVSGDMYKRYTKHIYKTKLNIKDLQKSCDDIIHSKFKVTVLQRLE